MFNLIQSIKSFFERQAFGVCAWWGDKLNIESSKIRVYFIYVSFVTLGSPLLIYLIMAFLLEYKNYFPRKPRKTVWDL
jgi:phage shock protein PspC (stress-responsive transcriptional regulator)